MLSKVLLSTSIALLVVHVASSVPYQTIAEEKSDQRGLQADLVHQLQLQQVKKTQAQEELTRTLEQRLEAKAQHDAKEKAREADTVSRQQLGGEVCHCTSPNPLQQGGEGEDKNKNVFRNDSPTDFSCHFLQGVTTAQSYEGKEDEAPNIHVFLCGVYGGLKDGDGGLENNAGHIANELWAQKRLTLI